MSNQSATRRRRAGTMIAVLAVAAAPALVAAGTVPRASAAMLRTLPGTACPVLPADSVWHADVSRVPKLAVSAQWIAHMQGSTRHLHADFGPSYGAQPVPYGLPVTVVDGSHPTVPVQFTYADESDRVPYPFGVDTRIEGGSGASGDRHAIVVDSSTCRLYETWNTRSTSHGWTAGSGATWDLRSNALRPAGWTSADAAGLPILPGLLRYDEVKAGDVDHAIRFTTNVTDRRWSWPARHQAGSVSNRAYPPMGAWFRLKSSYTTRGFHADARVVIAGMKKHGLVLADNGSPWFFQGTEDTRWPSQLISELARIPASAFEAVDVGKLAATASSGRVKH